MAEKGFFTKKEDGSEPVQETSVETKKEAVKVSKSSNVEKCTCDRGLGATKVGEEYFCNKCKKLIGKRWPDPVSGTKAFIKPQ